MPAPWTPAETEMAQRLTAQRLSPLQVSQRVGRSVAAIRAHLDGANGSSWTPERIAKLRELWDDKKSSTAIGVELGVSKNAVVGMAHRQKLSGRASPIRPARTEPLVRTVRAPAVTLPALACVATPLPAAQFVLPGPASAAIAKDPAPLASAAGSLPAGAEPVPAVPFSPPPAVAAPQPRPPRAPRECIWISGERPHYVACSEPAVSGRPFCEAHCKVGFTKATYVSGVGRIAGARHA